MLLHNLLQNVNIIKIVGDKNIDVKNIYDDSRKVKKGGIFVAIKGLHMDSHNLIDNVINEGSSTVVVEEFPENMVRNVTYVKVNNSREALSIIASNFYGSPSQKMKMIGVTGTKGKTTTTTMIYHILKSVGKNVGLVSSIDAKIGEKTYDTGFHVSNPEPIQLQKFLAEMVAKKIDYAVLEVTSHGIHQKRIAGIKFDVTVLTNIAPEHLDYHKTFSEYKKVKMSFLKTGKHQVIPSKNTSLKMFPGRFNNLNAEAAIKAVSYMGVNKVTAMKALDTFKLPEGRLEEIKNNKGFRVFIDFAHTPDSIEAALEYLKSITKGKLISVFGSAGERDPIKRPKMGAVAAKYSNIIVLTSEDPRSEDPAQIIKEIRNGIKNHKDVYEFVDREKAIEKGLSLAHADDVVALLGKGHEKSMNMDGKKELPWSEYEVVRKHLKAL